MNLPGPPELLFLAYLFVLLPLLARKSARRIRGDGGAPGAEPSVSRTRLWASSCAHALLLFAFAWWVGRQWGYDPWALAPGTSGRETLLWAALALALLWAIRQVLRATRSEEERRALAVYRMSPRAPLEWCLWVATVLAASAAEEAAYRGVAMQILWWWLGQPWIAASLCCLAFAAAHWVQGRKSGVAIFAIAAVMHGLVQLTGALLAAMVVHALYDLVAGWLIHRQRVRDAATDP